MAGQLPQNLSATCCMDGRGIETELKKPSPRSKHIAWEAQEHSPHVLPW